MQPTIKILQPKKLVGLSLKMSLVKNLTGRLWGQFGPRIREIQNRVSEDKISMQVCPPDYYAKFSPTTEFTKWAAVEVSSYDILPEGLQTFDLHGGLYAVFDYKGSSADTSIFQYIFTDWLPKSGYVVDDRPHFEILGPKYKNNDPNSEEEIWIPVREK
ncbi:GyrI-like domain-containing protein [Croceivirga thetidis]|uniref:GyrI-like domain-containing protein n=1 Tax=Croceivirga thetidis TaxID=2721623 RepID=A0ABX1GTL3_9FLAO|nr:GyrI-like domain-containing protein [Croceivirga thetidis]NKI32954.1 GyrI-like domain-containing protein [Croceivirga thetidis]